MKNHLITTDDLSREEIELILEYADVLTPVSRGEITIDPLRGAVLANLFFEPSTRTRISFGTSFSRLGGSVLDTAGEDTSSLVKGESIADTARVVSGYADCIVLRHASTNAVELFSEKATVPVINAGAGSGEHPTQALTDIFTLRKELSLRNMSLEKAHIAIVGDLLHGRAAHSFLKILTHYPGCRVSLLSPDSLMMPEDLVRQAIAAQVTVSVAQNIEEIIQDTDAIYLTRYQRERFSMDDQTHKQALSMRLSREIFKKSELPVIMHPLPRDANFGELSTDLDEISELAIFRQTDGGVAVRMAIFLILFDISARNVLLSARVPEWRSNRVQT